MGFKKRNENYTVIVEQEKENFGVKLPGILLHKVSVNNEKDAQNMVEVLKEEYKDIPNIKVFYYLEI